MDRDACVDCQRCEQVCDMGIPVWRQGQARGRVTGLEDCMGCGRCVVSCPTDALEFRDVRNALFPKLRMNGSHLLKRPAPPEFTPRMEPARRPASERRNEWREERQTLSLDDAMAQARRCLDCGVPGCQSACPLNNRIPEWLDALGRGDVEAAAAISNTTSTLPEICGAVCPSYRLCEGGCTLNAKGGPVMIGALEHFINEEAFRRGWRPKTRKKPACGKTAAVIGAGPAGLACAEGLNKAGFHVTVFDKRDEIGGLLSYGLPSFKLDKAAISRRRKLLEESGIRFELGVDVEAQRLQRLIDTNNALFLGTGAQRPRVIDIFNQKLEDVVDGLVYLSDLNTSQLDPSETTPDMLDKRVLVLGGGVTAIYCARCAVRQGAASVTIAYRRGPEKMRASPKEIAATREEGVDFVFHKRPQEVVGEGKLEGIRFKDDIGGGAKGGQGNVNACDVAIVAFGQEAERTSWLTQLGIATDAQGFIAVDKNGRTSHPKVFSGGDNAHGPDLVVTALAAGRRAAQGIVTSTG